MGHIMLSIPLKKNNNLFHLFSPITKDNAQCLLGLIGFESQCIINLGVFLWLNCKVTQKAASFKCVPEIEKALLQVQPDMQASLRLGTNINNPVDLWWLMCQSQVRMLETLLGLHRWIALQTRRILEKSLAIFARWLLSFYEIAFGLPLGLDENWMLHHGPPSHHATKISFTHLVLSNPSKPQSWLCTEVLHHQIKWHRHDLAQVSPEGKFPGRSGKNDHGPHSHYLSYFSLPAPVHYDQLTEKVKSSDLERNSSAMISKTESCTNATSSWKLPEQ